MKIRELFENVNNIPVIHFAIAMENVQDATDNIKTFTGNVKWLLRNIAEQNIKCTNDKENLEVAIEIHNPSTLLKIDTINNLIIQCAEDLGEIAMGVPPLIKCNYPPSIDINLPGSSSVECILDITQPNTSLKDISKHVSGIETLTVRNCQNATGLLGLVNLKNVGYLDLRANKNAHTLLQAEAIIQKHLQNGQDILECQEELIDAGLKEYAKF